VACAARCSGTSTRHRTHRRRPHGARIPRALRGGVRMSALAGKPIAINAMALLSPRTGIGQYTFHLVRELQSLLADPPYLFYAGPWSRELRTAPAPSAGVRQSLSHLIPNAYKLSRFLQQRRFSAGVRAHGIRLYHEPNFVALRFAGPI